MAKTKMEKEMLENQNAVVETQNDVQTAPKSGPSYDELMSLVKELAGEVQALKSGNKSASQPTQSTELTDLLSALTNRKSDREVSIVHNCELNGGLTTHIELTNTSIDFRHVGETRLLSWQQFEECASKYRSFFDAKVILVANEYSEVAQQYSLPYVEGAEHTLTQSDMRELPKMDVPTLEKFITNLQDKDKDTVFSYWLGKCYSREEGFYDRHKMDTLNRLSNGMFDNILLVMNGEGRNLNNN